MARRFLVHDEICFVMHATEDANAEGAALAVPAWMTEAASAQCEIVNVARIPVTVLAELRGLVDAGLSSLEPMVGEGGQDGRTQGAATRSVRRAFADAGANATTGGSGGSTAGQPVNSNRGMSLNDPGSG